MVDLSKLSPPALKAAIKGGTTDWGSSASEDGCRYVEPLEPKYRRRKCHCGCDGRATHRGMVNGVDLVCGCELSIARWQRDPRSFRRPKVFQIGDPVTVNASGTPRPAVVIGRDEMAGKPTLYRVEFPHGGNCLVPVEWMERAKAAPAAGVGGNVVVLRRVVGEV